MLMICGTMDILRNFCLSMIIVVFCLPSFVQSCTCPQSVESFEMKFCLADYSYLGEVKQVHLNEDEGTLRMSFEVIVKSIYHGMEDIDEGTKLAITTSMSETGCGLPGLSRGLHLFQGRGSFKDISKCDYVELYENVHPSTKENLSIGSYSKLCAYFYNNICLSATMRSEVTVDETTPFLEETTPYFDDYTTDDFT
ncbi:hypothetical protein HOLleu_06019 [Holothuria leucospilota]|uniref:NTR domain-containing protein n=1 Tax=Holothuria leucospilota TaxID=206669 RepID=A0A9Q1HHS3_HOLLE|nr:hypothetical protein HOLleu_06019 [Holothuria leucospilota]